MFKNRNFIRNWVRALQEWNCHFIQASETNQQIYYPWGPGGKDLPKASQGGPKSPQRNPKKTARNGGPKKQASLDISPKINFGQLFHRYKGRPVFPGRQRKSLTGRHLAITGQGQEIWSNWRKCDR